MRMTIDIDENNLDDIMKFTRMRKKSPAVSKAIDCFCKEIRRKEILSKVLSGKTDYTLTNKQLEDFNTYDSN
ncbi:MAG TPA: hypothetical protein DCZ94_15090 [Lentisphaeria bacterium]|nr:MAG: hypothetical protein A2X48_03245 [Lentisphaerae bacterium GWF2_49_21]HBC88275.1 hypothetical protein [Lentisphaeria bacterium]